ncbi:uncharacterized protein LOC107045061 [Diachasma alloeum]|uniref:uncharacterized protein LOC107045061 n=1 Tax=Diachasma alloeum TaxID=454923 RepID=UPI0010FBB0C8|nr:uncharacterized protein LOC107045061 [Diachasma alloeum]
MSPPPARRTAAEPVHTAGTSRQQEDHGNREADQQSVLLATARVKVISPRGFTTKARALIDQGSEVSFISEQLVNQLHLQRRASTVELVGISGIKSGHTRGIVSVILQASHGTYQLQLNAHILKKLTAIIPSFSCSSARIGSLQNLHLADPHYLRPGPIAIILGADNYGRIIMDEVVKSEQSRVVGQRTVFGWILSGPIECTNCSIKVSLSAVRESSNEQLLELLQKFWVQEGLPNERSSTSELSPDEYECEMHFRATHSRDNTGRYIVRLPLKTSAAALGESKFKAARQLKSIVSRLNTDQAYSQLYREFINKYAALGHMRIAPETPEPVPAYYLPHHGVLREEAITTKLRVVFNGSSPSSSGMSLNDILYSGEKLENDAMVILTWMRRHRLVFGTDIVKMFRQIRVHQDDWDLQRILWIDENQQPVTYQLTTRQKTVSRRSQGNYKGFAMQEASLYRSGAAIVQRLCMSWAYQRKKKLSSSRSQSPRYLDCVGINPPTHSDEYIQRWKIFRENLNDLDRVTVPRWLRISTETLNIQIHGFADASTVAMSTVVYIRTKTINDSTSTVLACAKTKVAPLKRMTIPRLELTAALLLTQLVASTKQMLQLDQVDTYLWADSSVALAWIRSHASRWKDFVHNRVVKIQETLPNATWRHVSGKENPADCASRAIDIPEVAREAKPAPAHPVAIKINEIAELLNKYQTMAKLLAVTATVNRAIDRFRRQPMPPGPVLTTRELNDARLFWSRLTTLVIEEAHHKTLHGGTQLTLAYTRQRYWIIGGRGTVRAYIQRCAICTRHRGRQAQQPMGPLPATRFPPARAFLHTGVDYAGPFTILKWRPTNAQSGDNSTTFVGAAEVLDKIYHRASRKNQQVQAALATNGTQWSFSPPRAPHFGGQWEAAVKSTKYHLRRVLGTTTLTFEELNSVVIQIEACLNSRPICRMSDDPDDLQVLTPGHFLIGEPLQLIPKPSIIDKNPSNLQRWNLVTQLTQQFWFRWAKECLQRYQAIYKWTHREENIKVGDMVLMIDENYPLAQWPIGRVIAIRPGADGLTKVATIRTAKAEVPRQADGSPIIQNIRTIYTELDRPITKLCLLPSDPPPPDQPPDDDAEEAQQD